MTFFLVLLIILSVAVTLRRDKSIYYNKIAIISLIYSLLFTVNSSLNNTNNKGNNKNRLKIIIENIIKSFKKLSFNNIFKKALLIFIVGYVVRYLISLLVSIDILDITFEYLFIDYFSMMYLFVYSVYLIFSNLMPYGWDSIRESEIFLHLKIFMSGLKDKMKVKLGPNNQDSKISQDKYKDLNCMMNQHTTGDSSDDESTTSSLYDPPSNNNPATNVPEDFSSYKVHDDQGNAFTMFKSFIDKLVSYEKLIKIFTQKGELELPAELGDKIAAGNTHWREDMSECEIKLNVQYNITLVSLMQELHNLVGPGSKEDMIRALAKLKQYRNLSTQSMLVLSSQQNVPPAISDLAKMCIIDEHRTIKNNIKRLSDVLNKVHDKEIEFISVYKLSENPRVTVRTELFVAESTKQSVLKKLDELNYNWKTAVKVNSYTANSFKGTNSNAWRLDRLNTINVSVREGPNGEFVDKIIRLRDFGLPVDKNTRDRSHMFYNIPTN